MRRGRGKEEFVWSTRELSAGVNGKRQRGGGRRKNPLGWPDTERKGEKFFSSLRRRRRDGVKRPISLDLFLVSPPSSFPPFPFKRLSRLHFPPPPLGRERNLVHTHRGAASVSPALFPSPSSSFSSSAKLLMLSGRLPRPSVPPSVRLCARRKRERQSESGLSSQQRVNAPILIRTTTVNGRGEEGRERGGVILPSPSFLLPFRAVWKINLEKESNAFLPPAEGRS